MCDPKLSLAFIGSACGSGLMQSKLAVTSRTHFGEIILAVKNFSVSIMRFRKLCRVHDAQRKFLGCVGVPFMLHAPYIRWKCHAVVCCFSWPLWLSYTVIEAQTGFLLHFTTAPYRLIVVTSRVCSADHLLEANLKRLLLDLVHLSFSDFCAAFRHQASLPN